MTESREISEHFIDTEKLFRDKNPRLHRLIPGFLFRMLRRLIHEDFINTMIYKHRDKTGLAFVSSVIEDFGVKIEVFRSSSQKFSAGNPHHSVTNDLFPSSGRYIIAANHPLGGLDGLALIETAGKIRPDIIFPVNDLLMYVPGLKPLFIPINKHGRNTENVQIIDETFAGEKLILFFPAGLVSRKQGKNIKDLEWKKTFITRAKKYQRDIIPVYISGQNSGFFYNLSNWRRRLRIKANIEMLFLPDEMVKQKDKTITIVFGDPIPYTLFDKTKTDQQWAEVIKKKVYKMGKLV